MIVDLLVSRVRTAAAFRAPVGAEDMLDLCGQLEFLRVENKALREQVRVSDLAGARYVIALEKANDAIEDLQSRLETERARGDS